MRTQFHFTHFDADASLRIAANSALERILARAPYGTRAVAILAREGDGYRCSVDLYSKRGPFIASSTGATPHEALRALESKLTAKLELWRANRSDAGASVRESERAALTA